MKKFCLHKPLLVTLITAFIIMQWSATHIHLGGEHKHDGDHHQHTATVHQHQLDNHHTDNIDPAIDVLSHSDDNKVVELELVCTQCKANSSEQSVNILTAGWTISEPPFLAVSLVQAYQSGSFQPFYLNSSIRPRAPPLFS